MIAALAGIALGVLLLLALGTAGTRGGWLPLHCDPAVAAAERHRPPWNPLPPMTRECR